MAGLQLEGFDQLGSNWFSIRKEIEENSPSRKDGIDMKKEAYFRKSYCTFLQDLGMRLKVPQVTIASAIMFCHRFFLRQSHAKNDRMTVATVCMFLAGKVEETPRPLRDVILISYEIIHKKDSAAVHRIKQQRELYEQQKELILMGERLVLGTLGFDLNMLHLYKPLVEAIKKFKVAQNALAQVAWNFVNDGLRTSLCLQFKPHHIAAGAIFLAAKFLKVKLPNDGDKFWWQEFDVTPRQLEDVSNQMLELYEQNRLAPSNGSEVDDSDGAAKNSHRSSGKKIVSATEEQPTSSASGFSSQVIVSNPPGESSAARPGIESELLRNSVQNPIGSLSDHKEGDAANGGDIHLAELEGNEKTEGRPSLEVKEVKPPESLNGNSGLIPSTKTPSDVIAKIDKEKYKAALEKRRKNQSRGEDFGKKPDVMDDYDLIERELENGVEMAERERKQLKNITASKAHSISANPLENDNNHTQQVFGRSTDRGEGLRSGTFDRNDNVEEGELPLDAPPHPSREYQSPMSNSKKRKPEVSPFNRAARNDHYHDREHSHRNYRQETRHA